MSRESVYVKIIQSNYLRKNLLQSTVSTIMLLQRYYNLKKIKLDKIKEIENLDISFKKIYKDFRALKKALPHIDYEKEEVKKETKEYKKKSKERRGHERHETHLE
ncbi:hypothetical protein K8R47_03535, partial [archaeon]|nr:hypothetical protein [archaeon]